MAAVRGQLDPKMSSENRRAADRRKLHLEAQGTTSLSDSTTVLIQDISRTGLLLETSAELSNGETIEIELSGRPGVVAVVKWSSGNFYGCEFTPPVSDAVVSAALLRAPPKPIPTAGGLGIADPVQEDADKLPRVVRVRLLFTLIAASWTIIASLALIALL